MPARRYLGLLAATVLAPQLAVASPLTGNWARDDGTARISIAPCGENLCAVNTWVKNPAGREHVGDELILTLTVLTPERLQGQAYDVRRHLSFSMTITLTGAAMRTSGCVFLGLVCKSAGWSRIN